MIPYKNQILETIRRHIPVDQYYIFVFGSAVNGLSDPRSDIDIGILGDREVDWSKLAQIKDELKNSNIPYEIDIVDFNQVDEFFKQNALKKAEIWNKPKKNFLLS